MEIKKYGEKLWTADVDSMPQPTRALVKTARFLAIAFGGFSRHRASLHAAGLTLFSILSAIPVLLLMLLLTKPCGMYDYARAKLVAYTDQGISSFFERKSPAAETSGKEAKPATEGEAKPTDGCAKASGAEFGAQARQLRDQMLEQVDKKIDGFSFGTMAIVGFLMLAWTVVSTFGQVEASFNEIWNVEHDRGIVKKAVLYFLAVTVLPLLAVLAMSMPVLRLTKKALDATLGATSYTRWVGDALVSALDSRLLAMGVTLLFASLAFAFVFKMMPNRKVSTRASAEGGFITAVMMFALIKVCTMIQFGIADSSAAYGSFALLPILIIWINMSWKIVLLGSNMTYALQCVHSRVRDLPVV